MRESIRLARAVFSQPSFAPFCAGEMEPGPGFNTDAELDDFAARKGDSSYHPSCTCRMGDASEGGRDGAVVDAKTMGVIGGFLFPKNCEGFFWNISFLSYICCSLTRFLFGVGSLRDLSHLYIE